MAAKFFNVYYYRKLATFLIFINIINVGLLIAVGIVFLNRGDTDYYATNGYMPPIGIYAMNAANESAEPLLPADPPEIKQPKIGVQ